MFLLTERHPLMLLGMQRKCSEVKLPSQVDDPQVPSDLVSTLDGTPNRSAVRIAFGDVPVNLEDKLCLH